MALAELSPQAFAELKAYAESQGDFYLGLSTTRDDDNKAVYYWRFGDKDGEELAYVFGRYVSNAHEAIVALQTSAWTHLLMVGKFLDQRQKDLDASFEAYRKNDDACTKHIVELQNKITELEAKLKTSVTR